MNALQRFVDAQSRGVYEHALGEIVAGAKRSHWMWFVFPQIAGLGRSATARLFAIADGAEAAAYLADPVLGTRLLETTRAMLSWAGRKSAEDVLGDVDAMKFRSSMTLFGAVAPEQAAFGDAIKAFFDGSPDAATLERL